MEKQEKGRLKLVLVPCPFQGHINPMLQLGTFFHSRGFSITVVHAQYNSPNPSSHPDFHFLPLPDTSSDHNILTGQITAFLTKLNTNCKDRFQECLAGVKGQHGSDHGISCIIHDEFMYFSGEVATDLKLPSIIFRTNSAATFFARAALIQLMAEGNFPFPESRSQDPVPELYPLRFKDLPLPLSGTFGISPIVNKASDSKTSSAIIHNTIDCLESSLLAKIQQQYQVPIFPIGPVHRIASTSSSSVLEEDRSCLAWLEKQSCNSVIYVSLGSVASMDVNEIVEMAWGLANSRQSFLWVIRPGSVRGAEWTEVLPQDLKEDISKRSYIVKWAPQKEVLVHAAVGGFLSHCGWNSTLESISEGIPMICRPCFGDQRVNTRYLTEVWRVGLELEGELERGEIEKAIRRLMVDEEGKELRKRANILKEKVELCLKEEAHVFKADLPGLKKEEVKVEIEENRVLQISGERNVEKEDKNDKWHKVERSSGKFVRRFRLPENVKIEEVKASMENGVLTVTVPKEEVKKPDSEAIEISG